MKIQLLLIGIILALAPNKSETAKSLRHVALPRAEIHCLAQNIYHEARGEPVKGQLAVAYVTLNRKKHPQYPKSICGVVYQKSQFSWTAKASKRKAKIPDKFYHLAFQALEAKDFTKNSMYFHTTSIRPSWSAYKLKTHKIGNHVFYSTKKPQRA